MDIEEIKERLMEGTLVEKLEAMSYLDSCFDSYDQNIPQFKEIVEFLIHFALEVQDDEIREEIIKLIYDASIKDDFVKVNFDELEQGLIKIPIEQLHRCIDILGYSHNKKYIKTIFQYRNHEDKYVRLSVGFALSELGYQWTGLCPRCISEHKMDKSGTDMSIDNYYSKNPGLRYIGKKIVEEVLDKANEDYMFLISTYPNMNGLKSKLASFSQEQIDILFELIPWITSGTLCNMLRLFDQNEDIQFIVEYEGKRINLSEVSNGLDGELLVEEGWVDRFGKYLDFMAIEWRKNRH